MTAKELVIGYEEPLSRPLTFAIERGEKIVLTGANGIGKTTLLKSILGLIPSLGGDVELGDYLEIGYFEQEMPKGNTNSCIQEIWEEFPSYTQYEVRAALAKCGLTTQHIESLVRVLSGGEQAKVRLCKLINRETNLLVLDEPTTYLDIGYQIEVLELVRRLNRTLGITILMVLHDLNLAARYSDILAAIKDGGVFTVGSPDEVLTRENISALFGIESEVMRDEAHDCPFFIPK